MNSAPAVLTRELGVYFIMVWACATGLAALLAGIAALWRRWEARGATAAPPSRATTPDSTQP